MAPAPAPIRRFSKPPKTSTACTSAFAPGSARADFTLHLLGAHNASNALAGLAVALEAGVDLDAAVAALASLTAGDKRGQVIEIGGATILNDSYNSNPEALRSMIRTLAARPAGRRILVAGEMLELGEHGPALHTACGRAAAEAGLDLVVGVQGNAEHLAAAACTGGVASLFLPDAEAAGRWLAQNLRPGDVVLVKGSRGVHLETRHRNRQKSRRTSEVQDERLAIRCACTSCCFCASRCIARAAQLNPAWTQPFPAISHRRQSLLRRQRGSRFLPHRHAPGHHPHQQQSRVVAPLIQKSVETLGFHFSDIKILLISHAHYDHCAGSAQIMKLTGAKYYVMDADVPSSSPAANDFQYASSKDMWFPPAHVDRVLHDGDTVASAAQFSPRT